MNRLLEPINKETIRKIDAALDRYANLSPHKLLDEVYKEFAVKKEDSIQLEQRIKADVKDTMLVMNGLFERYHNRQSLFLAATLESVSKVLSSLKTDDTVRRGVVFKLTEEIIHKCQDAAGDLNDMPESEVLRPSFVEIAELESYLIDYCESKDINSRSLRPKLEELLKEEDARRLQKTLRALPQLR